MRRSTDRIIVSHAGSLPRPPDIIKLLQAKETSNDASEALQLATRRSVIDVVRRQAELGIDVVDDGEHSKISFASYARLRLSGLEPTDKGDFRGPTRGLTGVSRGLPGTVTILRRACRHARLSAADAADSVYRADQVYRPC